MNVETSPFFCELSTVEYHPAKAETYYGKLAALAQDGEGRPELQQARRYLAAR